MRNSITISGISLEYAGGHAVLSADVTCSDKKLFEDFVLWYRFPGEYEKMIAVNGNPFLAIMLPIALRHRCDLVIKHTVSQKLLRGCDQIMELWKRWFPNIESINVSVDNITNQQFDGGRSGMFFSGGVDSFYTLLKKREDKHGSPITDFIFLRGYDINLENDKLYDKVHDRLKTIADEFGINIIQVSTNIKQLSEGLTYWGKHQHGAVLAGTGLLFSREFDKIYIASGDTYSGAWASSWGSHPLLDPLWSDESLTFIHDGNEATRVQKILWQVSKSPVALEHLRVCYLNPGGSYNCCECDKCIRTMIDLRVAGVLEKCKTFPEKLHIDQVKNLSPTGVNFAKLSRDLMELRRTNSDLELQETLAEFLEKKPVNRLKKMFKKINMIW